MGSGAVAAEGGVGVEAIAIAAGDDCFGAQPAAIWVCIRVVQPSIEGECLDCIITLGDLIERDRIVETIGECSTSFVDRFDAINEVVGQIPRGAGANIVTAIFEPSGDATGDERWVVVVVLLIEAVHKKTLLADLGPEHGAIKTTPRVGAESGARGVEVGDKVCESRRPADQS